MAICRWSSVERLIAVIFAAILLIACDPSQDIKRPIVWRAPPLVSVGSTAMSQQLADDRVGQAPLHGQILEKKIVQHGNSAFQHYTVNSRSTSMLVEADVYAGLVRKGYTRQVKAQAGDVFSVDYVKQGDVTISAQYSPLKGAKPADGGAQSQIVFIWKVSA